MYGCPNCRAQVAYGQSTCGYCGVILDWGVQQAPSPPSNQPPRYQRQQGWRNQGYRKPQNIYDRAIALLAKKHSSGIHLSLIVLVLVLVVAGGIAFALSGNSAATPSSKPPAEPASASVTPKAPPVEKPPAITFSANPGNITKGQKANLSWDVTGATAVSIDQGIGTVTPSGTKEVFPTETTTYVLTATNDTAYMTALATVAVTTPLVPVITSFTATPGTISAGQSASLQWNVSGANAISIDNNIGIVSSSWTQTVFPSKTTTYTLTATNREGSATASVTITVAGATVPVVNSFTATPSTITAGQISTLQWDVNGATSVSINQDIGVVYPSGTKEVSPTVTTTYVLTARNNAGSVTASATVTLPATSQPVIDSFTANPLSVASGQTSTLQWNVTGATTVSINQGIGTVTASDTRAVLPSATTTYTLTATNSYGSVTRAVTVMVTAAGPPVINSFTADATTITRGQTTTLRWNITNATSASITPDVGNMSYGLSQVTPTETTTYTLTATNSSGSVTAPVTVTVQ